MDTKNVLLNHTLDEYKKKYRNRKENLISISKKEVEDFDKKYKTNKGYLLEGRKWWLIGDTYYQIPKAPGYTWFRNLNAACQIGTCVLAAGVIAAAVTIPTLIVINNNRVSDISVELIEGTKDITISSTKVLDNGALEITLKPAEGKELASVDKVVIGNQELKINTDYTLAGNVITINKDVIEKHKGEKIVITPKVQDTFDPSKDFESDSEFCNVSFSKKQGNDYIYEISIKDTYKATKEFEESMESVKVGDFTLAKTDYAVAKDGDKLLLTIRGDIFTSHQGKIKIKPKVVAKGEIILNKSSVTIGDKGKTYQLKVKSNTTGETVTWSSDSNDIKVKDDGTVYTEKTYSGSTTAKITATAGGKIATCNVTCEEMYNINWLDRRYGDKNFYEMCVDGSDKPTKLIIGTNEKYASVVSTLTDKETYNANEEDSPEGSIVGYFGINPSTTKKEAYFLADKKISFEDDDRTGVGSGDVAGMFYDFHGTDIILDNIDTSALTDFTNLFTRTLVTQLDVSNLNTQNAVTLFGMFNQTQQKGPPEDDVLRYVTGTENFDTSNVTDMRDMFKNCKYIGRIDLSSFDTSNVDKMENMFSGCKALEEIITSDNFDVNKVIKEGDNGNNMFEECESLVGSASTKCDGVNYIDATRAKIDGGAGDEGYFYDIKLKRWYQYDDWYNRTNEATLNDVGHISYFQFSNNYFKVRLIGLNHDDLTTTGKAKTTWEFSQLLNEEKDLLIEWNKDSDKNTDFPNSILNKYLNNKETGFLSKIPEKYLKVIKEVKKTVGTGKNYDSTPYNTYFFPLSVKELGYSSDHDKGYGTAYDYYADATEESNSKRAKCNSESDYKPYWTRSPGDEAWGEASETSAWYCGQENGTLYSGETLENKFYIAPGFCI